MMTIVCALGSLFFAGINDLVFKSYGQKPRSIGAFVALIGAVWSLFFLVLGYIKGTLVFAVPVLCIGALAGMASGVANILLIEAMKKTGAGIGSTIYRLNLVFVAVMAFLVLHETFNAWKTAGLIFAVVTIILLFQDNYKPAGQSVTAKYIILLIAASFLRACMGICYKIASQYHVSDESFLFLNGLCWLLCGAAYMCKRERAVAINKKIIAYACLSGLLVCGIVLFMKLAVNYGDASVAITISQLSFIITFPGSVLLFRESCSCKKIVAIILALACVILLAIGQYS